MEKNIIAGLILLTIGFSLAFLLSSEKISQINEVSKTPRVCPQATIQYNSKSPASGYASCTEITGAVLSDCSLVFSNESCPIAIAASENWRDYAVRNSSTILTMKNRFVSITSCKNLQGIRSDLEDEGIYQSTDGKIYHCYALAPTR